MRIPVTIILILATTSRIVGQSDSLKTSDIDSLYVRTLRTQLGLILSSGFKYFEINERTERIKDIVKVDRYKFLTREQLIDQAIKDKKKLDIYFINHKIISADTVDVNIGNATLSAKKSIHFNHGLKTRKAFFEVSCGGTEGYVPTERFAYNSGTRTWDKIKFIKPKTYRERLKENKIN